MDERLLGWYAGAVSFLESLFDWNKMSTSGTQDGEDKEKWGPGEIFRNFEGNFMNYEQESNEPRETEETDDQHNLPFSFKL